MRAQRRKSLNVDKKPFGCEARGKVQNILYGGRWWLPPSPGCGESYESEVAHGSC